MEPVLERAPAKINLRLRIVSLEPDGYHTLETLFQALELHDALDARIASETTLQVEGGVDAGPPERNLVLRAARAFRQAVPDAPDVEFRLSKRIPAGAGLGGGSSDAAAALRALNALSGMRLGDGDLARIGATLGSDVAFFLCGSPLAAGTGRGELLVPLRAPASVPVVVVDPGFAIATRDAFAWWDAAHTERRAPMPVPPVDSFASLRSAAMNDFESVVFPAHPQLGRIRDALVRAGATFALLCGSGSCIFGLFADTPPPADLDETLRAIVPAARVLRTRTIA